MTIHPAKPQRTAQNADHLTHASLIADDQHGVGFRQVLKRLSRFLPLPGPRTQKNAVTLPVISTQRLASSQQPHRHAPQTYLYLAYGSNLSYETFQDRRGIRPLASINVVVPDLRLTFDLPGVPYREPCFANSAVRSSRSNPSMNRKGSRDRHPEPDEDEKDRWRKGMVGVVYEVTPKDYAHIIATEGGGQSYQDIIIPCHPLAPGAEFVPKFPSTPAFEAHTLFAPPAEPGEDDGQVHRPDPSYAQPSARYLKLITDGAEEHDLPREYREYLRGIRPYKICSPKTRLGAFVFDMLFMPFLILLFALMAKYQDENGKTPPWLATLRSLLFKGMWGSYDSFFKPLFGDGERTEPSCGGVGEEKRKRRIWRPDGGWAEKV